MVAEAGSTPRMALACWDYSWLTRRDGRADEYRDLARVVAELAERGYNTLRLDVFPHLLARGEGGLSHDRFDVLPEANDLRRGAPVAVQVQPRRALLELLKQARVHGIRLWLASWFVADTQARRSFVRRPQDFVRVWAETLAFIEKEGFADLIYAVDFCHEFPLAPSAHGAYRRIFNTHPRNPLPQLVGWSGEVCRRVEEYLVEVPRSLRALYPRYRFGVSVSGGQARNMRQLDTSELDFLDSHTWLNDDPRFRLASGELLVRAAPPIAERVQARAAALLYRSRQTQWTRRADERLSRQVEFARMRRVTPVLAEGFVRHAQERALDWGWVREVSEHMVVAALEQGISIVTPGIYARPQSPEFWNDIAWQQRLNAMICGSEAGRVP